MATPKSCRAGASIHVANFTWFIGCLGATPRQGNPASCAPCCHHRLVGHGQGIRARPSEILLYPSDVFRGDYEFTMFQLSSLRKWFLVQLLIIHDNISSQVATWESRGLANECTHSSSMTIFVYLFIRNFVRKITIVTSNIILNVAVWWANLH